MSRDFKINSKLNIYKELEHIISGLHNGKVNQAVLRLKSEFEIKIYS